MVEFFILPFLRNATGEVEVCSGLRQNVPHVELLEFMKLILLCVLCVRCGLSVECQHQY